MGFVALIGGATVAVALALSATWKMSHPATFMTQFLQVAPRQLHGFSRATLITVSIIEITIGLLLLADPPLVTLGALAALFLLAALTPVAARLATLRGGCGCWHPSRLRREAPAAYVVRNLTLAGAAAIAIATPGDLPWEERTTALAIGAVTALVVMEVPSLVEIVVAVREGERI
jgi:hypothetical protein